MAKQHTNDGYQRAIFGALRTLMHFIVAVQFSYGIYYDFTYVHFPPGMHRPGGEFGGKLKFLTVWDAVGRNRDGVLHHLCGQVQLQQKHVQPVS